MMFSYAGKKPTFGANVFVAETATIIGDVFIGAQSSIWYGAVIRGDEHEIRIGARTNIQDNCVLHVTHGTHALHIGDEVTLGHGVIAHGCTIGRGALIGMGSRVLDGARIGELALIGAGALVSEGMDVPPRTLVVGIPGRVKRELRLEELAALEQSWKNYMMYATNYMAERAAAVESKG